MQKDNRLALEMADRLGVPMIVGSATQELNTLGIAAGHADEDSVAALRALEQLTGHTARRRVHEGQDDAAAEAAREASA
jgi:3-hydroxyisobutyrate dehydrogenase